MAEFVEFTEYQGEKILVNIEHIIKVQPDKNGSYIYFNEESKNLLQEAYGIDDLNQGYYLDGIVSRKKQMLPPLIEVIER